MSKNLVCVLLVIILAGMPVLCYANEVDGITIYKVYEDRVLPEIIETPRAENTTDSQHFLNKFEIMMTMTYNDNQIQLVPDDTRITSIGLSEGHLEVYFSPEICNYGGGTYEYYMINQLLALGFGLDNVEAITFGIEDNKMFVEGTVIENYTKEAFTERMKNCESN